MDRRIKAILVANNIYDLTDVEIIDYDDGVLEIIKNDKTHYISLAGEVFIDEIEEQIEEITEEKLEPFETKSQDEKIESIIEETKKSPIQVEITTIIEEVDDDLFNDEEKIDDDIDDFDVDLDDDFDFDDEVKEVEKVEEIKPKSKKASKKKKDDDFINLL